MQFSSPLHSNDCDNSDRACWPGSECDKCKLSIQVFLEELVGLVLASLVCTSPGHFTAKLIHRKERGKSQSNKLRRSEPKGGGFLEGWVGLGEEGRCLDSVLLL